MNGYSVVNGHSVAVANEYSVVDGYSVVNGPWDAHPTWALVQSGQTEVD